MKPSLFPTLILLLAIGFGSTRFVDDRINEISDDQNDYDSYDTTYDNTKVEDATPQSDKWIDYDEIIKVVTKNKKLDEFTWDDLDDVIDRVVVKGVEKAKQFGKEFIKSMANSGERLNNTGTKINEWGATLTQVGHFLNNVGLEVNDVSKKLDTIDANEVNKKIKEWKGKMEEIQGSAGNAGAAALDYIGEVTGQGNLRERVANNSDAIVESGVYLAKEIKKLVENPKKLSDAAHGVAHLVRKAKDDAGKRYNNVKDMIHTAGGELAKDIHNTVQKHAEKKETIGSVERMSNIQGIMAEAAKELADDIKKTVDKHVIDEETKETIERLQNIQGIMFEAGEEVARDIKKQMDDHVTEELIDDIVTEAKWNVNNFWNRATRLLG